MPSERRTLFPRTSGFAWLLLILAVALAVRLWNRDAGVPYAVGIDEPQVVDRAIRILHTGDWNTHLFDYPTLVIYLHAVVSIVRFLWGALGGEWASLDGFTVTAIYGAGRFTAAVIGTATVWILYRLGVDLGSRRLGLLAAAQLAVFPQHVRESHFILTDVPTTALTTLAMWLTVRAARLRSIRAYAAAALVCGLAAAAKYTGGVALVAPITAWLLHERSSPDRWKTAGAIVAAAAFGFFIGAPYSLLDMPSFLDGFAAQFARFAQPVNGSEPAWRLYLKHLSPAWESVSIPLALAGIILLLRRATWMTALPVVVFSFAYFYVLSSHSHVFGRYALPLIPMLCLFIAAAVSYAIDVAWRVAPLARPGVRPAVVAILIALLVWAPAARTLAWLNLLGRRDTRAIAADWLAQNTPKGTRLAVENSGPTYLDRAGFRIAASELLIDHPIDWYRERVDYLVISAADLGRYGDYVNAGPTVFQIAPTPQRWGPPILIVKVASSR